MRFALLDGSDNLLRYGLFATKPADPAGKPGWHWVESPEPPPQPPTRWEVRKLLIIDRLSAAGLFDAAMAALGGPGALAYERWSAASVIDSDDAEVRGLLSAIGGDPDTILALEA